MKKNRILIFSISLTLFILITGLISYNYGYLVKTQLTIEDYSNDQKSGDEEYVISDKDALGEEEEEEEEEWEAVDGLLMVRQMDKELIVEKIKLGKEFLYRMEHQEKHGFYKRYNALEDSFENRIHTVYSASIIYTFLYIYDYDKDKEILKNLDDWGNFLLSMQNKDINSPAYGAFHYSYFLDRDKKEVSFPVGTSALSIFTLLRLYEFTGEEKYLEAAKLAGDWLTTMGNPDGSSKAHLKYFNDEWVYTEKVSLLYNGQVLSALSKLYKATGEEKYYNRAQEIANYFTDKYEKAGRKYIVGEYRTKNPISNAWVVMSLMDFYKINPDDYYKDIIFELSSQVLENQFTDTDDIFNHGRWDGAYSTSGIGWISEVMTDTYRFCLEQGREDCEKYKEGVVGGIRWVLQNTYSKENSSDLLNPERASGGIFWNKANKYIRADSVCHALNAYTRIINYLDDGLLISIP